MGAHEAYRRDMFGIVIGRKPDGNQKKFTQAVSAAT